MSNQQFSYQITMHRPDRKKSVNRYFYDSKPVTAVSVSQLVGFLTHKLFADKERGGDGTLYVVKVSVGDKTVNLLTVRKESGRYRTI